MIIIFQKDSKSGREWERARGKEGEGLKLCIILMMCTGINLIYSILIALTYCIKRL